MMGKPSAQAARKTVVLVWQDARRAQLVERGEGWWTIRDVVGGGEVAAAALGVRLTLDEIYEGVELPAEPA